MDPFEVLGIDPTEDARLIRQAYARQLKANNPEDDAEGFQRLREAYEAALQECSLGHRGAGSWPRPPEDDKPQTPAAKPAAPDELEVAWRRLHDIVRRADPNGQDAMQVAAGKVFSSTALEEIDRYRDTEIRVARLIGENQPYADPLIESAVRRFNWRSHQKSLTPSPDVEAVLARESDLLFLKQIKQPYSSRHQAYRVLSAPPRARSLAWRSLWSRLGADVQELLTQARYEHTTLLGDLDPAAVAWWENFLERSALPPNAGVWVAASVTLSTLVTFFLWVAQPRLFGPWTAGAVGVAFGLAASIGGMAIRVYGYGRLKRLWDEEWQWSAPPWVRGSWASGAALLLAVATLAPWTLLAAIGVALAIAALIAWTHITVDWRPEQSYGWQVWGQNVPLAAWWCLLAFDRSLESMAPIAIAAMGAGYVVSYGAITLYSWVFLTMPRSMRVLFAMSIVALSVCAAWSMVNVADGRYPSHLAGPVAAFVTFVVLLQRAIAIRLGTAALTWRYYLLLALFFASGGFPAILSGRTSSTSVLVAGAGWFLCGVVYTILVALALEVKDALEERKRGA